MKKEDPGIHNSEDNTLYANIKKKGGLKTRGICKESSVTPLVSVIPVVRNGAGEIEKTIHSVINQDYQNIEFIIIDGGSQDQTLTILQRYDESIDLWISEPDRGIFDAMNKGFTLCTGAWIIFINAGDTFYSDTTVSDTALDKYDNSVPSIIYGNTVLVDDADREIKSHVNELKLKDFHYVDPICHQSVFFSNSAFLENGLYNTEYRIYGDYEWLIRFFKKATAGRNKAFCINNYISRFKMGGYHDSNLVEAYKEKFQICDVHFSKRIQILMRIYFILVMIRRLPVKIIKNNYLIYLYRRIKYS